MNLKRFYIVLRTHFTDGIIVQSFDTLDECKSFLSNALKDREIIEQDMIDYTSHCFWYDVFDSNEGGIMADKNYNSRLFLEYEEGESGDIVYSTEEYFDADPVFVYVEGQYTYEEVQSIKKSLNINQH